MRHAHLPTLHLPTRRHGRSTTRPGLMTRLRDKSERVLDRALAPTTVDGVPVGPFLASGPFSAEETAATYLWMSRQAREQERKQAREQQHKQQDSAASPAV